MTTAYIHDAVRTPRGKARRDGGLASLKPQHMVAGLIEGLERRGAVERPPDALVLGAVGQVGAQGGNIALVSKLHSGLPDSVAAWSLNNYCVSSLTAIGQAAGMVAAGNASTVLAGGVEMMSRVPFMADNADFYADAEFTRRTRYIPVALAADRLADREGVTRPEMDGAALESNTRALAAEATGLVASRLPTNGLDRDECARLITEDSLARLPPAFGPLAKQHAEALAGQSFEHRHTVAHAPPMSDGAALALVTASAEEKCRARVMAYAESGGDPEASLTAGLTAAHLALKRAGIRLKDVDRIEFMEAFAVAIVLFLRNPEVDSEKVNVGGGHLAKGHPMGATGAILLSSLLDALDVCEGRIGLVVASGAHGVGCALVIERLASGPGR